MRSLRSQLILLTAAATGATFIAAGFSLYFLMRASLLREFDAVTFAKARALAAMTEFDGKHVKVELEPSQLPEFQRSDRPEYYAIVDASGTVVAKSATLSNEALPIPERTTDAASLISARLPNGRDGRLVALAFHPREEGDVPAPGAAPRLVIAVARETSEMSASLDRLRWLLLAVGGAATAVLLVATSWAINRGLRPLGTVAADIASLGESNLAERVDSAGVPEEIAPIVLRLNELLARLETAFEREKSFTADAAHELRTPLAGLEAALEVCASRRRQPAEYQEVVVQCLDVARGMHGMVDSLLLLARADADTRPATLAPERIDELLQKSWDTFEQTADRRGLEVRWDVPAQLTANTDSAKLRQVLDNLFANAVRYSDDGGRMEIGAHRAEARIRIRIANTGSQVASSDASRVFDRFWRGDAARSSSNNYGIGLSVCRKLVDVVGGSIAVTSELGGMFVAEVSLPAAPNERADSAVPTNPAVREPAACPA